MTDSEINEMISINKKRKALRTIEVANASKEEERNKLLLPSDATIQEMILFCRSIRIKKISERAMSEPPCEARLKAIARRLFKALHSGDPHEQLNAEDIGIFISGLPEPMQQKVFEMSNKMKQETL